MRGHIDIPLNDMGFAHAKSAGDFLKDENIGKIYYSRLNRAKQTAEGVAGQHATKVEMIEEPLVLDIHWGGWEGMTYEEAFGSADGGDYFKAPERLIIPGETIYEAMGRLRRFLEKFWKSDEEVATIVTHGAMTNCLSLIVTQGPLSKFWNMYMNPCGVTKLKIKGMDNIVVDYWNAHFFQKEGEEKYMKK